MYLYRLYLYCPTCLSTHVFAYLRPQKYVISVFPYTIADRARMEGVIIVIIMRFWFCREGGILCFQSQLAIASLSELTYPTFNFVSKFFHERVSKIIHLVNIKLVTVSWRWSMASLTSWNMLLCDMNKSPCLNPFWQLSGRETVSGTDCWKKENLFII